MSQQPFFVHESAVVDAGARIGEGTKIWHFSHVSAGAEIGPECTLGQNVYVADGVKIGRGCKIQNNVSLYAGVLLEDYVFCGPSMVFTNVKAPRAEFPRERSSYLTTRVGCGASIGANATLLCGVSVGKWAMIGAGAVVTQDVRDHARVLGVPAKASGWACRCGRTLALHVSGGQASAHCPECSRRYLSGREGLVLIAEEPAGPAQGGKGPGTR
jgi:UDP-2-acetamido-3-amino-2,3-dideoxy-glucuronate N-acetyltransferase